MYPAQPAEGPEHTKSTCCLQTSPDSTYKGIGVSNLLGDIFTGVLMTGKRSCRLMNLPFSACPVTSKGHLGTKLTPEYLLYLAVSMPKKSKCDQSQRPYYQVVYGSCIILLCNLLHCSTLFYTDFRINVIKDRGSIVHERHLDHFHHP